MENGSQNNSRAGWFWWWAPPHHYHHGSVTAGLALGAGPAPGNPGHGSVTAGRTWLLLPHLLLLLPHHTVRARHDESTAKQTHLQAESQGSPAMPRSNPCDGVQCTGQIGLFVELR